MKRWVLLFLSMTCISSVLAGEMTKVVDRVVVRFNLDVTAIPEFKTNEERNTKALRAMQIAQAYRENDNLLDSLRKYVYAYRIQPQDDSLALFMIGTLLIELKSYEEAVAIFEHMGELFPEDYRLNNNLGWIYCTADDPKFRDGRKAEAYALKALFSSEASIGDYHIWSTLAEARYVYGNYEKALSAAKQAVMLASLSANAEEDLLSYKELVEKCERALAAERELAESAETVK